MTRLEIRCNGCKEIFAEDDIVGEGLCPFCLDSSLFEREIEEEFTDQEMMDALDDLAKEESIYGR